METMYRIFLLSIFSFSSIFFATNVARANNTILGQSVQIQTHFSKITGKPKWVLILRDVNSGKVSPYLFDTYDQDNFWIALSYGHAYKIVSSSIKFGKYAIIKNFCRLEQGILSGKSLLVRITGKLTPNPEDFHCHILKYENTQFTIVPDSVIQ